MLIEFSYSIQFPEDTIGDQQGHLSRAGLFVSLAAGISALWGPLHGGANQAVIEMLEGIKADDGDYYTIITYVFTTENMDLPSMGMNATYYLIFAIIGILGIFGVFG